MLASTDYSFIMSCEISHPAYSGFILQDYSKTSTEIIVLTSTISLIDLIFRETFLTRYLAHFSFFSIRQRQKQSAIISLYFPNYAIVLPGASINTNPDCIFATILIIMLAVVHFFVCF